ncbi:MAG: HD domain-containing protein [Peptostreptococcaceae bacterium]
MNKFKRVLEDEIIVNTYDKISEFENIDKGWAHHNLEHVINVANMVEVLLRQLDYDEQFVEEAKIAAILHDVGALEGKDNHSERSYCFAKGYFEKNNMELEYEELILDAIKTHSDGFDSDNIIALVLILSDKLDIKFTRVAKEGYNVKGMKELQYIKDISANISKGCLKIEFICDEKINKKELEEFYFMRKVFMAITSFSNKMNLEAKVIFNNDKWELYENVKKRHLGIYT